jgi:hypothetical protein
MKVIMDPENEIIELDSGFDLTNIYPEVVLDSLGLSDLTLEDLLNCLKRGAHEVDAAFKAHIWEKEKNGMETYHELGLRYAAVAFAIYDRLFKKLEEPRLPTFLSVSRYQSAKCYPSAIKFWDDPDMIKGLYESLEKDGYYADTASTPTKGK